MTAPCPIFRDHLKIVMPGQEGEYGLWLLVVINRTLVHIHTDQNSRRNSDARSCGNFHAQLARRAGNDRLLVGRDDQNVNI